MQCNRNSFEKAFVFSALVFFFHVPWPQLWCQSCGSCESRFHLIPWTWNKGGFSHPATASQCHGIGRNICPLGVWLPRSSCWWACHPTRIALARLKASEASPQVQFQVPASTVIAILSACGIPVCTLLQGNVCTLSQKADYNTWPLDETTKSCHWQGHQPLKNTPPTSDWERWDSENGCHKQSYLADTDTSLDSGNFNWGLQRVEYLDAASEKWYW